MTFTVDIKKDYALSVLEGLEKIGAIDLKQLDQKLTRQRNKSYEAVQINLNGFRFNRDEANER